MPNSSINRSIEEIIIIATGLLLASALLPFSIYRFISGQHLIAVGEFVCLVIMCSISFYVWKTRKVKLMCPITSIIVLSMLVVLNYALGTSLLFWIYPIIMTVYFVNPVKVSVLLVTPTVVALLPLIIKEKNTVEFITIIMTLIICQVFGYLLSLKIREQYSVMEQLANQDGLTGALNRRAFDERIEFLHSFALRHKKKQEANSSIIIFDIDDFKSINDRFGHQEGDQILINLTKLFKQNIREIDQLYRYGGEEFVVIANGANRLKASELAEKLRILLETTMISRCTKVTASFGVAEMQVFESPVRWTDRADKAMYRAKRAGKNRVCISNSTVKETHLNKLKPLQSI